jgi:chemotaxis protein MotB
MRVLWVLLAFTLVGCGYSEEEWQAQLAKYDQLSRQHEKEKAARAQVEAELAAAKHWRRWASTWKP